jgi:hypothetical protein
MLSVVVEKEAAVFVHLIMGVQTQTWKDLHGNVVVNLAAITDGVDRGKPVILSLTDCEDEQITAENLPCILQESGGKYPFMPAQRVFSFTDHHASGKSIARNLHKKEQTLSGVCSRCGAHKELLRGLKVSVCASCATIDIQNAARGDNEKDGTD